MSDVFYIDKPLLSDRGDVMCGYLIDYDQGIVGTSD